MNLFLAGFKVCLKKNFSHFQTYAAYVLSTLLYKDTRLII